MLRVIFNPDFFNRTWYQIRLGIVIASFLTIGCAPEAVYIKEPLRINTVVAVLPMNNQTNDFDGPGMVRKLFVKGLEKKGYRCMSLEKVDELLKDEGITDGGQLGALSYEDLRRVLQTDVVVFGTLIDFSDIILGYYQSRTVSARFSMVDLINGEGLWENEKKVSKKNLEFNKDKAVKSFKKQLLEKTVEKTLKMHLLPESELMIYRILKTLPDNF